MPHPEEKYLYSRGDARDEAAMLIADGEMDEEVIERAEKLGWTKDE
jgi:hypothetical protein